MSSFCTCFGKKRTSKIKTEAIARKTGVNLCGKEREKTTKVDATDANFDEVVLGASVPVIVDMWAEWCGPCKMIEPYLDDISNEYGEKVLIARVDVDASPGVAIRYGARSIPMLLFVKDGKVVDQVIGAVPKKQVVKKLNAILDS